ncbi:MAG: hypothetical protein ACR2HR_04330 [Euzebya sp.]
MQSGEFIDTPAVEVGDERLPPVRTRVRRPLNGGWVLMIAAGLMAAVANYALVTREEPRVVVPVLTASAPAGTPVQQLQWEPREFAIPDAGEYRFATVADLESKTDLITSAALSPGLLLRSADLRAPAGSGPGAMSIPIDRSRAAGGLLVVGDRVAVIADVGDVVDFVVSDVGVLEVLDPGSGVGSTGGSYAVVVSVGDEQALAIARAMRAGDIDLLRVEQAGGS